MYYKIEGFIYILDGNEKKRTKVDRFFENENPYIARQECFDAYLSFIDVFLLGIGKEFSTYEKAVKDLQDFFVKDRSIILDEMGFDLSLNIYFSIGLDEQKLVILEENVEYSDGDILIHSIGSNHNPNFEKLGWIYGLRDEFDYYNLKLKDYICEKDIETDIEGNKYFKSIIDYSQFDYDSAGV